MMRSSWNLGGRSCRRSTSRTTQRLFALVVMLGLLAAACGEGEAAAGEGIATLTDTSTATGNADSDVEDSTLSADEAALAFSACMRDEGIDFPDIAVDAEGRINLRDGLDDVDRQSEGFRAAMDTCRPLIEDAGFGAGGRAAIGENVELQDAFVEFSDCIRGEGFDVGDLTLGGGPAAGGDDDGEDADRPAGQGRGEGQRQEGFGDPANRLAQQLGLDLEDPLVEAAIELCSPVLEEAFTAQGVEAPGARP